MLLLSCSSWLLLSHLLKESVGLQMISPRGGVILPQLNAVQNVKQLIALLSKRIPRARKKAADRVLSFARLLPDVTKVFYPDHYSSP